MKYKHLIKSFNVRLLQATMFKVPQDRKSSKNSKKNWNNELSDYVNNIFDKLVLSKNARLHILKQPVSFFDEDIEEAPTIVNTTVDYNSSTSETNHVQPKKQIKKSDGIYDKTISYESCESAELAESDEFVN